MLETSNIVTGSQYAKVERYVEAMRSFAKANNIAVADTYEYTVARKSMILDGKHPNSALYLEIGTNVVAPTLAPFVSNMLCK